MILTYSAGCMFMKLFVFRYKGTYTGRFLLRNSHIKDTEINYSRNKEKENEELGFNGYIV